MEMNKQTISVALTCFATAASTIGISGIKVNLRITIVVHSLTMLVVGGLDKGVLQRIFSVRLYIAYALARR
jgi:hypothetical protein